MPRALERRDLPSDHSESDSQASPRIRCHRFLEDRESSIGPLCGTGKLGSKQGVPSSDNSFNAEATM